MTKLPRTRRSSAVPDSAWTNPGETSPHSQDSTPAGISKVIPPECHRPTRYSGTKRPIESLRKTWFCSGETMSLRCQLKCWSGTARRTGQQLQVNAASARHRSGHCQQRSCFAIEFLRLGVSQRVPLQPIDRFKQIGNRPQVHPKACMFDLAVFGPPNDLRGTEIHSHQPAVFVQPTVVSGSGHIAKRFECLGDTVDQTPKPFWPIVRPLTPGRLSLQESKELFRRHGFQQVGAEVDIELLTAVRRRPEFSSLSDRSAEHDARCQCSLLRIDIG